MIFEYLPCEISFQDFCFAKISQSLRELFNEILILQTVISSHNMLNLNLPAYSFKIKSGEGRKLIFDEIRRKYVVLTPEEWVRQNFVQYLVREKSCPASLISLERQFDYNRMVKRADILIHNRSGMPVMMVECKAPDIKINQETFNQIALYNLRFNVPFLIITNGIEHYCCRYSKKGKGYRFLKQIPDYQELICSD